MREIVFKMERPGLVEEGVKVYSGYTNSGFNVENGRATGLNVVAVSSFKFGPNGGHVGAF